MLGVKQPQIRQTQRIGPYVSSGNEHETFRAIAGGGLHVDRLQLRAAQVKYLYSQGRMGVIGAQVSALILPIALWGTIPGWHLAVWLACYFAVQIIRNRLLGSFPDGRDEDIIIWGKRFSALTVLSGGIWGATGVFLFPPDSPMHQFLLALFLAGLAAAASVIYSPLKECYIPTLLLEIVPLSGRCFYEFDALHFIMGLVMLVFMMVLLETGRQVHTITVETLRLRFEKNDLIESLTRQKTVAEELNDHLRAEVEERTRAEEALRASEERLALALTGADLGLWDYDLRTDRAFFDRRWTEMLGYSPEEIPPDISSWMTRIHPDDVGSVKLALENHLAGSTAFYESEHRLGTRTSNWKWVLSRGKVVERSANGTPLRITGTHLDITSGKSAQEKMKASLEEKEVLLREIHHRVKNNLQVMSSLLSLQRRHVTDAQSRLGFLDTENRVRSMALVHEQLYEAGNMARLEVEVYVSRLLRHLGASFGDQAAGVAWDTDIDDVSFGVTTAVPLGFIITELVSNCFKHAFPNRCNGLVKVSLKKNADCVELVVADDGAGIPPGIDFAHARSLGLRLVRIFVDQLGGEIEAKRNGGTMITVRFELRETA